MLERSGNLTIFDAYKKYATKKQKQIVKHYVDNDIKRNELPIVIANKTVLDGNHRLIAAILKNAPINAIDVYGEEYTTLTESTNSVSPFTNSVVKHPVYHGSNSVFDNDKIQEIKHRLTESNDISTSVLDKFKTNVNTSLIESIKQEYSLLFESLSIDDILDDPLLDDIKDGGKVIAYHGTNVVFDKFDKRTIGTNFKNTKDGFFFSNDMDYVKYIANKLSSDNGGHPIIYKCELTLGRTFTLANYFDTFDDNTATKMYGDTQGDVIDVFDSYRDDIIKKAKLNNCDSINFRSLGVNLYVVFDSNNIKILSHHNINNVMTESITSEINYRIDHIDNISGQNDWQAIAELNGKVIGVVDFLTYNDDVAIKMVNVSSEFKRKGIATKLIELIQNEYPTTEIDFGMSTEEGSMLLSKLREKDILYVDEHKKKRIERLQKLFHKLSKMKSDILNKSTYSDEEGALLDRISDMVYDAEQEAISLDRYDIAHNFSDL